MCNARDVYAALHWDAIGICQLTSCDGVGLMAPSSALVARLVFAFGARRALFRFSNAAHALWPVVRGVWRSVFTPFTDRHFFSEENTMSQPKRSLLLWLLKMTRKGRG
jgi:hypothetical protein